MPLQLLVEASDDIAHHWLAFLSLEDLKALSAASRWTSQSSLRRRVTETAVWRLPYPPAWRLPRDSDSVGDEASFDWVTYEPHTYLHRMDATTKRLIRAVSVPRSALLEPLLTHLPGARRVRTWQLQGDIAGIKTISLLARRRVYQQLREIDMSRLCTAASQLKMLTLRNASLARLPVVGALQSLVALDLSHTDIDRTFSDFQCLTKLTQLQSLNLERTGLSDLAFLRALPQLVTLCIAGAAVSTLEGLAHIPGLKSLDISNVWLENEVVPLSSLSALCHLKAELLGAMSPLDIQLQAPSLEFASFRYCWLQHRGFLSHCPRLQELDLRDTILFDDAPTSPLPHLETLFLSSNPAAIRSIGWYHTFKLRHLQLTKWDPAAADAERFDGAFLATVPQLTTLELTKLSRYTNLPQEPPQVSTLTVQQVKVSHVDTLAVLISRNHKLQTLRLAADRAGTFELPPLANALALCELQLTNVTLVNLETIVAATVNLRSLEISGFGTIPSSDLFEVLSQTARLRSLKICQNTAFDDLKPIVQLHQLEVLSVRHTGVKDVSPLEKLTTLQELELGYTHVAHVAPLRGLRRLRRVELPADAPCALFHDANRFPMLRSVVHEQVDGARECLLAGHEAVCPW